MRKLLIGIVFALLFINFVSAQWFGDLDRGLVYYYNMEETTGNITDTYDLDDVGYAVDLTYSNSCKVGDCIGFTGASDSHIKVERNWTRNSTIAFWVNYSESGTNPRMMDTDITGSFIGELSHNPALNHTWLFFVITMEENGTAMLYLNNTLVDSGTFPDTMGIDMIFEGAINPITRIFFYNRSTSADWYFGKYHSSSNYLEGYLDEVAYWDRVLNSSDVEALWNEGNGTTRPLSGIITDLDYPLDNSVVSEQNISFNASYSITGNIDLQNSTYYLWNSTNGLINSTTVVVTGNTTNTTSLIFYNFVIGDYSWNVYTCTTNATATNCEFALTNYSFTIGTTVIDENYSDYVYETQSKEFSIEIDLSPGSEISIAQLIYNGTNYTVSNITSQNNSRILYRTIDIPLVGNTLVNQTKEFFWSFIFTDESEISTLQETATRNHSVGFINLQTCNATYNTKALNFSFYDEVNQTYVQPNANITTSFESSFNYWVGGGSQYKNYTFQSLNSPTNASYAFCIYPYNPSLYTFKVNTDIDYSATGFRENEYHLRNSTLTDTVNDILLYLLDENLATKFFLTFKQGTSDITDAVVTVQKYFIGLGQYITTSVLLTDNKGEATMWQDLDQEYKYSVVKDGVLLGTVIRNSICSVAPCTLTVPIDTSSADQYEPYYDIYAQNILSSLTYDQDSKIVTYEFIDTTGLANYFRLEVNKVQYNKTSVQVCNSQLYSPAGTIICNLTGYEGEYVATGYVSRSPEKIDEILNFLVDDEVINSLGIIGIFIVIILIIIIVFAGAIITKGSPSGVLSFLGIGILLLKLATLFPFTWTVVISIEVLILFFIGRIKS